jgi:hypothetical protein
LGDELPKRVGERGLPVGEGWLTLAHTCILTPECVDSTALRSSDP